jgi:N6-L-threonylcarbamoyladenine synthase
MQAHVLANLIPERKPSFPFLCLTVSGGHTQIVQANSPTDLHILGETIDDAAGEAFDKSAKLLGLPYPGGPLIDKYAQQGNPKRFRFAEPQIPDLNFSFSGLKTSVLYFLQKEKALNPNFVEENLADICASLQATIINILLKKLKKAALQTGITDLCIAGGVSANSGLRQAFTAARNRRELEHIYSRFRILHRQCRHDRDHGLLQMAGGRKQRPEGLGDGALRMALIWQIPFSASRNSRFTTTDVR